jgi:hypothetical protein
MNPWLWLWAPQFHFPWSGAVAQTIDPSTSWFAQHIQPAAGDAAIEEKAFALASYGKQLGLITELLIELAEGAPSLSAQATESLETLRGLQRQIDQIKTEVHSATASRLAREIDALHSHGGAAFEPLRRHWQHLMASPTP